MIFKLGVAYTSTNLLTSNPWVAFADSITTKCGVSDDCHKELNQVIQLYTCSSCNDEIACDHTIDDGCAAWFDVNAYY